jgi:hypothetical protein
MALLLDLLDLVQGLVFPEEFHVVEPALLES